MNVYSISHAIQIMYLRYGECPGIGLFNKMYKPDQLWEYIYDAHEIYL